MPHFEDIDYDVWNDPDNPPVAPANDTIRQAIKGVMERHPRFGPGMIEAFMRNTDGYPTVPIEAIYGVKAGM